MKVIILINQEHVALNTYTERLNVELPTVDNDNNVDNFSKYMIIEKKNDTYYLYIH